MTTQIKTYKDMSDIDSTCLFFVQKLDQDFFPAKWSQEGWEKSLNADHFLNVIIQGNEIIGFSLYFKNAADSFAHLYKIVINKAYEGQKLGSKLLESSLNELKNLGIKEFYLEVEENNQSAIGLYKKFGFQSVHRKKNFYSNGDHALIMTLSY